MDPATLTLIFAGVPSICLCIGMAFSLRRLRPGWRSFFGWEAVPLLLAVFVFALIAGINWDYESKLLVPLHANNFIDSMLGPILLVIGLASALLAGVFLFTMRLIAPQLNGPNGKRSLWIPVVSLGICVMLLLLFGTATIVLGPAAITMREQMGRVPDSHPQLQR